VICRHRSHSLRGRCRCRDHRLCHCTSRLMARRSRAPRGIDRRQRRTWPGRWRRMGAGPRVAAFASHRVRAHSVKSGRAEPPTTRNERTLRRGGRKMHVTRCTAAPRGSDYAAGWAAASVYPIGARFRSKRPNCRHCAFCCLPGEIRSPKSFHFSNARPRSACVATLRLPDARCGFLHLVLYGSSGSYGVVLVCRHA